MTFDFQLMFPLFYGNERGKGGKIPPCQGHKIFLDSGGNYFTTKIIEVVLLCGWTSGIHPAIFNSGLPPSPNIKCSCVLSKMSIHCGNAIKHALIKPCLYLTSILILKVYRCVNDFIITEESLWTEIPCFSGISSFACNYNQSFSQLTTRLSTYKETHLARWAPQ